MKASIDFAVPGPSAFQALKLTPWRTVGPPSAGDLRVAPVALDNGADFIELSLRHSMPLNVVTFQ